MPPDRLIGSFIGGRGIFGKRDYCCAHLYAGRNFERSILRLKKMNMERSTKSVQSSGLWTKLMIALSTRMEAGLIPVMMYRSSWITLNVSRFSLSSIHIRNSLVIIHSKIIHAKNHAGLVKCAPSPQGWLSIHPFPFFNLQSSANLNGVQTKPVWFNLSPSLF